MKNQSRGGTKSRRRLIAGARVEAFAALLGLAMAMAGRALANGGASENERPAARAPGVLPAPDFNDATYATVGGQPLRFDLYLPATGEAPFPLAIYVHGGGWSSGTFQSPPRKFVLPLLEAGVAVASIQYRLTSQAAEWGGESVVFPAQIHDVKGAIRHLRANAATYEIDPARIAILGSSAGAHLAAVAGTSGDVAELEGATGGNLEFSSSVIAAATVSAPTHPLYAQPDFTDPPGSSFNHDLPNSPESRLLGFDGPDQGLAVLRANLDNPAPPFPEAAERANLASANTHVDPSDPPFFIVHGMQDVVVAHRQSERLVEALDAAGVANVFVLHPDLAHVETTTEIDAQLVAFLVEALSESEPAGVAGVVAR